MLLFNRWDLIYMPYHVTMTDDISCLILQVLPEDVHTILNRRLHISLTDTSMHNLILSEFTSKKDLVDALICSCYVPAFSAYDVPNYKGSPYLDGGFR